MLVAAAGNEKDTGLATSFFVSAGAAPKANCVGAAVFESAGFALAAVPNPLKPPVAPVPAPKEGAAATAEPNEGVLVFAVAD